MFLKSFKYTAIATITFALYISNSQGAPKIEFKSDKGRILADGEPFYIKGVNWFGPETIEATFQGLWPYATTIDKALDLLKGYDVNAIRVPVALDLVMYNDKVKAEQIAGSPSLVGKTYLEVLDAFVNACRERNMLVVFDNHRIEASEPDFPDIAKPKDIIPALKKLAERYCNNPGSWNVLGIDIKNEPKGSATWGTGDAATDWDLGAAEIGNAVLSKCKRFLIFVEGVQNNIDGVSLEWGQAGGSLQGVADHPVKLSNMERLVYSPHLMSPGVDYKAPWWSDSSFPANMPKIWDEYFGFVPKETGNAVVIGSWGAKMDGKDAKWAKAVATYLKKNSFGSFYWALNPQSADTGGLVSDDWQTPKEDRFELLASLPSTSLDDIMEKYSKCSGTCEGNGVCNDEGLCECYAGWSGPQCDVCSDGDAVACNNGGTCQSDSTCLCDTMDDGLYCQGKECEGIDCGTSENAGCVNGQCVCTFFCEGNECEVCAADAKGLGEGSATLLCGDCPAADSGAIGFTSLWLTISGMCITALYYL